MTPAMFQYMRRHFLLVVLVSTDEHGSARTRARLTAKGKRWIGYLTEQADAQAQDELMGEVA